MSSLIPISPKRKTRWPRDSKLRNHKKSLRMWDEDGDLFNFFGDDDDDAPVQAPSSSKKTTSQPVADQRPSSNFVGLMNQYVETTSFLYLFVRGATCYLNSLLQALYMTSEFRQGIYDLVPDQIEQESLVVEAPQVNQEERVIFHF